MATNAPSPWAEKSYLIIDDFPSMRQMLRDMLRSINAKKVEQASNGAEAIDILKKSKFDVVLCDFNMGVGRSGQQVLEEAKINDYVSPACIWFMVTSEKSAEFVMGAAEHQPDDYLLKPLTESFLINRLNRAWGRKQIFKHIDIAYAARDYLKAIKLCDEYIAKEPIHTTELLRMKARLLLKCGETAQARSIFEKILEDRDVVWAMTGLAKIHIEDGEYESAQAMLENVIKENPYCIEAYDLLALAIQKQNKLEEAEKILIDVAKLSPNSAIRQKNLGEIAMKLGNTETAEKAFRKCITVGEHSVSKTPDAYFGLARICGAKKNDKEALQVLTAVQKMFNNDTVKLRAKITEGLAYHESGQWVKARQSADALGQMLHSTKDRPDAQICLDMAELLFATGNKEAPIELLQDVVKNNNENLSLLADVQRIFDKAHLNEKGAEMVESWCNEAQDTMNKGVLLWKEGKLAEAVEWMRNAKQSLPSNARILLNFTHVLIDYIQKNGIDPVLLEEARSVLLQAENLNHDKKRFAQLMGSLEALRSSVAEA